MSIPRRYFGANSVKGGEVRLLDASSFPELVRKYFNTPVMLPCTRAEYHASSVEEQKALKDAAYVTPCSFPGTSCHRNDRSAEEIQLLCYDLDPQPGGERFVKDFFESPEALADALWPYSYILYTTASHTPENPRLRLMLPVEPCAPEHYRRFGRHVARNLLGIPETFKGSRESGVVSQPMYRPVCFRGETAGGILGSRLDGKDLTLLDLPPEDGDAPEARTYAYDPDGGICCDLAHLPVQDLEVADVRDALFAIDSDCDYLTWTRAISAVRHQFRGEAEAEDAYALVLEWSERGDKFPGADGVWAKWKSFRPDAAGRTPVTIRTLFHLAADHGWQNTKVATKLKDSVKARIAACGSLDLLMSEGADWIASMPLSNEIIEDALMKALQARMTELGGGKADIGAIKRQVRKERVVRRRDTSRDCPPWLLPWCYVSSDNSFYNTVNAVALSPESFNRTYASKLMGKGDGEPEPGCKPSVQPADFALNLDLIPKVDGIVYDPRFGGDGLFFEKDGMSFVNTYRTNSLPRLDERNADKALDYWTRHLNNIIREPWIVELVTDWAAWIVQNPGSKVRWQFFIQGAQGCGKTFILNLLGAAIGQDNIKLVGPGVIKGDFNDWAVGAQVCGIEEVWVQGRERAQIMNSLKEVSTNDWISLNRKFKDVTKVENFVNLMAFSNHHNGLYMEETDRRWCIVKCSVQSKAQALALTESTWDKIPYFDRLAEIKNTMGGALRYALLARKISPGFNPNGSAPWTPYRKEMIEESKNPLQRRIEDIIEDGAAMVGRDIVYLPDLEDRVRRESHNNHPPSHYLTVMGYRPYAEGRRFGVNGSKGPIYVHPDEFDEGLGEPYQILLERHASAPEETI